MGLTIYTGGTFDLFHAGHVQFLSQCAQLGAVTIALNTDEFITTYKGKPPVMNYHERKTVLEACKYVSAVVENINGMDSTPTILQVEPNIIAIGSDWARRDYYKQMGFTQDWLDEHNISLLYIPYTQGVSSTNIKARVNGLP